VRLTILLFPVLLFCQCSIEITGFNNGYNKLSAQQLKNVLHEKGDISDVVNDKKIHVVNAAQIKASMLKDEKSLVYIWSPNCHGKFCDRLLSCQEYCDERGLELYVVSEYYDWPIMQEQNVLNRPIFTIDTDHYGKNFTPRYLKLFRDDLGPHHNFLEKNQIGSFFFFEKDQLVDVKSKLL